MSIKKTVKMVEISALDRNLFVRMAINPDHVEYLAELLEGGVELPPIKINPDNVVIDGRHRIEAYELCDQTEIPCEIVEIYDMAEMTAMAFKANIGGALPPTPQDMKHTVHVLLSQGNITHKRIAELLGLPVNITRKLISQVQSETARAKLLKAVSAVTNGGLTVPKAAELHDVDPEKLRNALSGTRKIQKLSGVADIKRSLTANHKSLSLKDAAMLRTLFEKLQDGEVSAKQVQEILDQLDGLVKRTNRSLSDWKRRFRSQIEGPNHNRKKS